MRKVAATTLVACGALLADVAAEADPRLERLPHGAVDLSADGCVVLGPGGVLQRSGIATSLMPDSPFPI